MLKKIRKISLLGLLFGGIALAGAPAVQAQINTGIEYGSSTGLSGGNITTMIGRIIQAFLGILGVVALVLIIYAGFLWMTAGGNDEQITKAKRMMAQAVIGLAIVLSSFAITSFVVSRLVAATNGTGGNNDGGDGGNGGDGGGLSLNFVVDSITPPGSKEPGFLWPKNSLVRVVFRNGSLDPATAPGSISVVANGSAVSGTIEVSGNSLVFTPTAECTENPAYNCLPGNSDFTVQVSPALVSATGKALSCGKCSAQFKTGDFIDTENPTVSISSPGNGESVSVGAFVPVVADAHDDSAVAGVEFFADDVSLGSAGNLPWQIDWDTTGIPAGTQVTLKAKATDAAGNTSLAAPITVIVRPSHCFNNAIDGGETGLNCGDGCGACSGGTCSENADCSSGLCQNGLCVNRPRIDSVSPLSGGPGTLITITGASFGSNPGEVMFLGADSSGDEKVAVPCTPSAWTDTQAIVTLPEGAASGPIQIANAENLSDRTDDSWGNVSIPDFAVNADVKPGICSISPANGPSGTQVEVGGNGFGDSQGASIVTVAGRTASVQSWSGTKITMAVPNLLGGTWPVVVTAGGNNSNGAAFSIPVAADGTPHITTISPSSGPVGEYVTITGNNFGTSPGKVSFVSGNDTVIGGTDFPLACGNSYWHDNSVTVKVPSGLLETGAKIKITRADAVESDNSADFKITSGAPKPGICRIDPSSGPVGITYVLSGERLGASKGHVTFRNDADATPFISSWNDSRIDGSVPAGAVTGRFFAVSASADQSNSLNFAVADCRKASVCVGADECCTDGACRSPNADGSSGCNAPRTSGSYRYRFSTGDIPVAPQVAEEIICAVRAQSPTPYKDAADACVNSVIGARFTLPMNLATLNAGNVTVRACGSAVVFDRASCAGNVDGIVTASGGNQALDDGFVFTPQSDLKPKEWYEARIAAAVTSSAGVPMNEDYIWHFRVRDSADPCVIESVTVSPSVNRLTDIYADATREAGENKTFTAYKANPQDAVCNELKCEAYAWSWRSDSNAAQVVNPSSCRPEVRALSETVPGTPALISATAVSKTGTGQLTVKFADPMVVDKWPACQSACLEAQIAASFNTALSNVSSATVKLFKCNNETCMSPQEIAGYTVSASESGAEHLAVIHPEGASLEANTYYRVVVLGGTGGVHSSAGANLIGTNYAYGAAQIPSYSWVFRTSQSHCQVDSVSTVPSQITTSVVGSYHGITAVPRTAPDSCTPAGERIDADGLDFSWNFNPNPPGAANLYADGRLNARPLASAYATSSCLNSGSSSRPVCGDGIVENGKGVRKIADREAEGGGEECDLSTRNGASGSGCSSSCLLTGNAAATCGNGNIDAYTLGDGSTQAREQCDLGSRNGQPGSGCSAACLRLGSNSTAPASTCGNGDLADNEQCDLGAKNGTGSGCSAECLDEGSLPGPAPICGNGGQPEVGEDCDPPNGKTCSASCKNMGTLACTAQGGAGCCGNGDAAGTAEAGEDAGCDLGWDSVNRKPLVAPGCNASCRKTGASLSYMPPSICGDGVVGIGETYDPGAAGGRVDPEQFAQAVGEGNGVDAQGRMITKIRAAVGDRSGETEFTLQCGYKSDANCPANTFLGSNSCCYPRPVATIVSPKPGETAVCRNPLIEVGYDRHMDAASFKDKVTVTGPMPSSGKCPSAQVSSAPHKSLWARVTSFFGKVASFFTGKEAGAQSSVCTIPGTVVVRNYEENGVKRAAVRFILSAALDPNTVYGVRIDTGVKSADGVPMVGATAWSFTAGPEICSVDAINVDPSRALFTGVYAGALNPETSGVFRAQAVHFDAAGAPHALSPIPGVYAWQVGWASSDSSLVGAVSGDLPAASDTATVGVKKAENGQVTLAASASITDDVLNTPSTKGSSVRGISDITVLLCKNPWPARNPVTRAWAPAYDPAFQFSFYYCRDGEDGNLALPALNTRYVVPANTADLKSKGVLLNQYLYTYDAEALSGKPSLSKEGIGVRVSSNMMHLSPTDWYASKGFKGKPSSTKVDGYEALADGRTTYVNAPSIDTGAMKNNTDDYTNVFAWSYTEGAGAETQSIFKQIMANMRFVAALSDLNICSSDAKLSCTSDLDCSAKTPGATCAADRSKVRRDVKRLADLRLIAEATQKTGDFTGTYPLLASGSFLPGRSYSTWPSWSGALSQAISGTPPTDPVNKLGACGGSDRDPATCWSSSSRDFMCAADSHVYGYTVKPTAGFNLIWNRESNHNFVGIWCEGKTTAQECSADPWCYWAPENFCYDRLDSCFGALTTANQAVCGNGVVENGEQCEKSVNPSQTVACVSGPGNETDTCNNACQWQRGACVVGKCGNGIKDVGEVCDNGSLNGTYGHCNSSCTGIGQSCGDGTIQQGEACDNGIGGKTANGIVYPPNGAWSAIAGRSCSLDCRSYGDYCGDNRTNAPNEVCDGGSDSSVDQHGAVSACPATADGRPQTYTRSCAGSCQWGAWGACAPVGTCGNGSKETSEQCDKGAANSDNSSCTSDCRLASCGDGHVWAGREQCDGGPDNIDPATAAGQAAIALKRDNCSLASCYYCTNACTVEAVSGGYCGDGFLNPDAGEECELGDTNGASCTTTDGYAGERRQNCDKTCRWGAFSSCTPTAYCGDGSVNGPEACDMAALNDGANGHCKADCSGMICAISQDFVGSNVANTLVSANADMSGAVPVTDVGASYRGGDYDKLANDSVQYVWSSTVSPPGADVNPEIKYFAHYFDINCEIPANTRFVLHVNVDDEVDIALNNSFVGSMSNLKNQTHKYAKEFDVTSLINRTGTNTFYFVARNFYDAAFLAYWLETTTAPATPLACNTEQFLSGQGYDNLYDPANPNAAGAPAVVQTDAFAAMHADWADLGTAKYLWNVDQSTATSPADWATVTHSAYIASMFVTSQPTANAILEFSADNNIDSLTIDGRAVTDPLIGAPYSESYYKTAHQLDITPYLSPGSLSHRLLWKVTNQPGSTMLINPGALIYRITAKPKCAL